ncbi:Alpha/beta hydrolase family protein [Tenacibaculum sp. MAR_2009_124]|uniref:alpha/beta hydrolase n=1 Tax=Tenacibaculum sp. MAR_2009_124 TaxID=1250059 RepID=UPI000899DEFF|nr:alpha/beta hydrolase fold domain-containing protein [Tenacibaculum sp. MAR_2009_124]SEB98075.1 Alpha/beta hydrolase family protein [Tenacibaculum sp. MAR_2009_124]
MRALTIPKLIILLLLLAIVHSCKKESSDYVLNDKAFLKEQFKLAKGVDEFLGKDFVKIYSLNQKEFTFKIDSLRRVYENHRKSNKEIISKKLYASEKLGIQSLFDWFILRYPSLHYNFTGEQLVLSIENQLRIDNSLSEFNKLSSIQNQDFQRYLRAYIELESNEILQKNEFLGLDNQKLRANWKLINNLFKNNTVKDYWRKEYLLKQIRDFGIENIESIYDEFVLSCENSEYLNEVKELYDNHKKGREQHLIEIYKLVDGHQLEMHLFLPEKPDIKKEKPLLVHFHGGSWDYGKPDWFFTTAQDYKKEGWVVAAVEYRLKGRHGTYPFEAVKDAKSALRWLRKNAQKYGFDADKIVVTGNSSGGHLAMTSVLNKDWNESNDDLSISPVPNVVIINGGVYDLTTRSNSWVSEKLDNKDEIKIISPNHLVAKTSTKFLLIHGENDRRCELEATQYFYDEMKKIGNDIELHVVKGANHFIWFGENSRQVDRVTNEFLNKLRL